MKNPPNIGGFGGPDRVVSGFLVLYSCFQGTFEIMGAQMSTRWSML